MLRNLAGAAQCSVSKVSHIRSVNTLVSSLYLNEISVQLFERNFSKTDLLNAMGIQDNDYRYNTITKPTKTFSRNYFHSLKFSNEQCLLVTNSLSLDEVSNHKCIMGKFGKD